MGVVYGRQGVNIKMGAGEVIRVLEKAREPMTSTEISEMIETSCRTARRILNALIKDSSINIKFKRLSFDEKKIKYGKPVNPPIIRVYWLDK